MNQAVTVHFVDGHTEDLRITQYEIGQFDMWALRQGLTPSNGTAAIQAMPIVFMRFGAYIAAHRLSPAGRPKFDAWDETVVEVEAVDSPALVPTETEHQGEPLLD